MDSESNQNKPSSDNTAKTAHNQVPLSQNQVQALSAQQLISGSGNVNMLKGRTIHLNLFVQKKS